VSHPPPVPAEELRGSLVAIRPFEDADAAALVELYRRNAAELRAWNAADFVTPTSVEEQRRQLAREREQWAADRAYVFGVFRFPDGLLVGRVSLGMVVRGALENAVLGYLVDREHTGRGYATEAARLALRFAFERAGLHRVEAGAMPANRASIRVLAKVGMRHEGTARRYLKVGDRWEDHEVYAITREEWAGRFV
jgi:ribosomal-protein-alanine N-acetyltransferase